jgi:fructose-bisphosphate aldolase class I
VETDSIGTMRLDEMRGHVGQHPGFLAALDQSGGSTPGALRAYGVPDTAYSNDDDMFALIHQMRVRIITAPSFTGDHIIGTILFERTMRGDVNGTPVPTYLREQRGSVPFLKIDKGLQDESAGVQMMKPIPGLDSLLADAVGFGVFGTKERSVIAHASKTGIQAIVDQQFEIGRQVASHGLVPILEPEVSIKAPDKAQAEQMLFDALMAGADKWTGDVPFMVKITIPDSTDLYAPLIAHSNVLRVVALSGGYERDDACARLAKNHDLIASFSRALVEGLRSDMSDADFDARLGATIAEIYQASTVKG